MFQAKYEQLATKFKETDTAQRFKDIFEECQKNIGTSAEGEHSRCSHSFIKQKYNLQSQNLESDS